MKDLTLEDIAKQSGVSRSTVSRVVNDHPSVSPEVRKRVLKVIQNTGFQPNAAARSLASQRSNMIGLVLPRSVSAFFTDPYFPQLTQGIAYGCNNYNLTFSLFLVGNKEDEDKILPRISRSGLLDGLLIQVGQSDDLLIDHLSKTSVPSVILGRPFRPEGVSYIDVDNKRGAQTAVEHLIRLNYQKIAIITGDNDNSASLDRLEGYQQALKNAKRKEVPSLIVSGDFTESSGYKAMKKLLPRKPDAVFASADMMAIGAIHAIQEAGYRIPEDIALVGFDDVPMANQRHIQLTTMRQPILNFGIKAVELLLDVITNGPNPTRRLILDTELVIRETCGASKREPISNG